MTPLSKKHRTTLEDIFAQPTKANIDWRRIESLFVYLGGYVEERAGSRIAVELNDTVGHFHRPHPQKEAPKKAVAAARDFLENAGVVPEGGK